MKFESCLSQATSSPAGKFTDSKVLKQCQDFQFPVKNIL